MVSLRVSSSPAEVEVAVISETLTLDEKLLYIPPGVGLDRGHVAAGVVSEYRFLLGEGSTNEHRSERAIRACLPRR
jgi:hypothetical protein